MPSAAPLLEIRLLGSFVVLRRDRTEVEAGEWRTGQTADLLRLLALQAGHPVRVETLLGRLWPGVNEKRARGSLRTAASQVRRTVRDHCIVRSPGCLMLVDAWVDAAVVSGLTQAALDDVLAGREDTVVSRARAMERLYRGDFHAHDDGSEWAQAERQSLTRRRVELLRDAAECCLVLGSHREALLYANAALVVDPTIEAAQRSKMRAYAELGEVAAALRTFEAYRAQLAADLGVDPSARIRALHGEILRSQ